MNEMNLGPAVIDAGCIWGKPGRKPPDPDELFEPSWCDDCYEESRPCACERLAADFAGRVEPEPALACEPDEIPW